MIVSIWLVYLLGEATYDWGASFIGKNKSQAGSSPKKGWEVGPGPQVSHSEAGALHTESQDLPPHVRPGGGLESQASGSEARKLSTDPQDLHIHKRAVGVATRIDCQHAPSVFASQQDPGTCSPTGSDPNSGSYPRSSLDVICNANAPSRSERDCPKRAPKKKCTPD
ncbi:uncharacterized protein LOC119953866 isoform X5 [Scyliorhinus canicula]|uniref:uncharacterized protein LOC119953866 isoform X5 n=1 Tax=Scyliorhinus canicula TaxID=7830 RepID=UPI0018F4AC42|nr:uncharacterized protein LOC119953866 isoform X5 [Scyliorhinus canicula]